MKTRIRQFIEEDREQVYDIYLRAFGKESMERWKKRWEWQFLQNPAIHLTPSRVWIAVNKSDKVVGYFSAFPICLKVGDKEIITFEDGDLMVAKEARRQGLGQRFIKTYYESEEVLVTSYNYVPATGRFFKRLGLKPVYCLPIYVRPFDLHKNFYFILEGGRLPPFLNKKSVSFLIGVVCRILNPILFLVNFIKRPTISRKYTVEEITEAGPEFDRLWNALSSQFPIIVPRDAKFVQWRFFEDPVFKHTILAARDKNGTLRGYIDICITERRGMLVGKIMDIFCEPTANEIIDTLVASSLKLFTRRRVLGVQCVGLHSAIQERVKRYLYFKQWWQEDPLLVHWKGDPQLESFVHDAKNWHLSFADGDQGFQP
jgi:GNAT superfamily N-acetyltransferase